MRQPFHRPIQPAVPVGPRPSYPPQPFDPQYSPRRRPQPQEDDSE